MITPLQRAASRVLERCSRELVLLSEEAAPAARIQAIERRFDLVGYSHFLARKHKLNAMLGRTERAGFPSAERLAA